MHDLRRVNITIVVPTGRLVRAELREAFPGSYKRWRMRMNSRRYRARQPGRPRKRQRVYAVPAFELRLIDFLVRDGSLPDGVIHSRRMIEEALALLIDELGLGRRKISHHR